MKKIHMFGTLLILLLLLVGCTKKEELITVDVDQLAKNLFEGIPYQDTLSDEFDSSAIEMFYELSESDYVKAHIYLSTMATAEEIAVFEGKDTTAADKIFKALQTRIENQKIDYEDYVPEELIKLNDPVLVKRGNYVVMCISNETDLANQIIEDSFKH